MLAPVALHYSIIYITFWKSKNFLTKYEYFILNAGKIWLHIFFLQFFICLRLLFEVKQYNLKIQYNLHIYMTINILFVPLTQSPKWNLQPSYFIKKMSCTEKFSILSKSVKSHSILNESFLAGQYSREVL